MKMYLISYELSKYSKKIYQLYKTIKECALEDNWAQCFNNLWIIKSDMDINIIYEKLKETLYGNDCFIVIEVTKNCDGWMDTRIWEYLNSKIFIKD